MTGNRLTHLSRRTVLAGLSATAMSILRSPIAAAQSGDITELVVDRRTIDVNGRAGNLLGIRSSGGRLGFEAAAGSAFRVRLQNRLDGPTIVHWHGLTPPSNQDGVPDLSQPPIAAGASYDYDFPLKRSGTFWMHSHLGLQQQLLMAPLIVTDPAERSVDEQPVLMMLYDFSFRPPEEILANLRKSNMAGMGMSQGGMQGMSGMSGRGSMSGMMQDINDIEYDAYMANDRTMADPDVVRVEPGGRIRLRIVNGAAATNFHIDLGKLSGELIAVDGNGIQPVTGTRFELAAAQRADIRLQLPRGAGAYPILALREGARERAGIVLAAKDATVARIAPKEDKATPPLGLALERRLIAVSPLAPRRADRVLPVELGGNMMQYIWTMNGKTYGEGVPLLVKQGERVELALRNATMMSHPIHLHGHSFEVVEIDGKRLAGAVRDTVLVPPATRVSVAFDADNPGRWAFHCHNLYHMESGMMAELRYAVA